MLAVLLGLSAGVLHVLLGPDHLVALAPLALGRRAGALRAGLSWGLGHACAVALLAAGVFALREALPLEALSGGSERLVGLTLVALGGLGLWRLAAGGVGRESPPPSPHTALFLGGLHGLAGSAHVLGALPALASPSRAATFARNTAISIATGDWLGFPDDDCWAEPGWISSVYSALAAPLALDALCLPLHDEHGAPLMLRWPRTARPVTRGNVWRTCLMAGFFIRNDRFLSVGGFDENLGVGADSPLGSGEETDLALRLLAAGAHVSFQPIPGLRHPARPPLADLATRAESYGRGFGYVWTRHRLSAYGFYHYCLRALGGCVRARLRGDVGAAAYYAASLRGRLAGRRLAINPRPPGS